MIIKKVYYAICKGIARIIFPKREVVRAEECNDEPCIYVCNHSGAIGPVNMTLWFDKPKRPWIVSYIFDKNVSANFVFHDFFYARGKKCEWFWRALAHVVVFFVKPMLEMQRAIKVFKLNARTRSTFDESIEALKEGDNVVIFPECPTKYSEYISELYDGFIQLGKYYYDETGKCLKFYPVYVPNQLKTINVGKSISYNPEISPKENRQIISEYLKLSIDEIARSLPKHKPVPFLTEDYYKNYSEFLGDTDAYWNFVNQHYSN